MALISKTAKLDGGGRYASLATSMRFDEEHPIFLEVCFLRIEREQTGYKNSLLFGVARGRTKYFCVVKTVGGFIFNEIGNFVT